MTLQSEINTSGFFTYIEWNGGSNYWSAPTQYTPNITSFPGASITHSIFVSSMSAITESLGATSTPIGFSVGCIFITYGTWQAGTIYLTLQCYENSVWRDTEIWDTAYIPSGINAITIFFRSYEYMYKYSGISFSTNYRVKMTRGSEIAYSDTAAIWCKNYYYGDDSEAMEVSRTIDAPASYTYLFGSTTIYVIMKNSPVTINNTTTDHWAKSTCKWGYWNGSEFVWTSINHDKKDYPITDSYSIGGSGSSSATNENLKNSVIMSSAPRRIILDEWVSNHTYNSAPILYWVEDPRIEVPTTVIKGEANIYVIPHLMVENTITYPEIMNMTITLKDPDDTLVKTWYLSGSEINTPKYYSPLKLGTYTAKFEIEYKGFSDSASGEISVIEKTTPVSAELDFDVSIPGDTTYPITGAVPLTVTITSRCQNVSEYNWNMGDGTILHNTTSFTHTYEKVGIYNVWLKAYGTDGARSDMTIMDAVNATKQPVSPPLSSFIYSYQNKGEGEEVNNDTAPCIVEFKDNSYGYVASYLWNFGDGTTSTQKDVTHRYERPGTYTVSLTVSNSAGSNTHTAEDIIQITKLGINAGFNFKYSSTQSPVTVNVISTCKFQYTVTTWAHDVIKISGYDDISYVLPIGVIFVFNNDISGIYYSGEIPYTLSKNNMFVITSYDTLDKTRAYIKVINEHCGEDGNVLESIFDLSNNVANSIKSWTCLGDLSDAVVSWNFNDGTEDVVGNTATHVYSKPGIYDITSKITMNEVTQTETKNDVIYVKGDKPNLNIVASITGNDVHFVAQNSEDAYSLIWSFGDCNFETSSETWVNHTYISPGRYEVWVTALLGSSEIKGSIPIHGHTTVCIN